jgi:hypothetical protein
MVLHIIRAALQKKASSADLMFAPVWQCFDWLCVVPRAPVASFQTIMEMKTDLRSLRSLYR